MPDVVDRERHPNLFQTFTFHRSQPLHKMRTAVFQIALAALVGLGAATPVERRAALEARQYPSFPGFNNNGYNGYNSGFSSGGDASSGNSGDVNGGNSVNTASGDGTVSNDGASGEFSDTLVPPVYSSCCSSPRWCGW